MVRKIVNRFEELLAEKERRDGRRYSRDDISEITGVSKTSVQIFASNKSTRFDKVTLLAFCDFLGCKPGDLLVIEEVEAPPDNPLAEPLLDAIPA